MLEKLPLVDLSTAAARSLNRLQNTQNVDLSDAQNFRRFNMFSICYMSSCTTLLVSEKLSTVDETS